MQQDKTSRSRTVIDAELLAVREMMAAEQSLPRPSAARRLPSPDRATDVSTQATPAQNAKPMRRPAGQPVPDPRQPGRFARLASLAWNRIRAYRPQRKRVLLTSLVLLFLLQPMLVLGWIAFGVVAILICYYAMGGDVFWRRIVAIFKALERRRPALARRIKLRSYVFSRKWDRQVDRLPVQLADCLRLPEWQLLLAADERHDAILSDRLRRLGGDVTG